MLMAAHFTYET